MAAALLGFSAAFILCFQIWLAAKCPTSADELPYYVIAFFALGLFFTLAY